MGMALLVKGRENRQDVIVDPGFAHDPRPCRRIAGTARNDTREVAVKRDHKTMLADQLAQAPRHMKPVEWQHTPQRRIVPADFARGARFRHREHPRRIGGENKMRRQRYVVIGWLHSNIVAAKPTQLQGRARVQPMGISSMKTCMMSNSCP